MNCQKGDLAAVRTNVDSQNGGKLLRVLDQRRCRPDEWRCKTLQTFVHYDREGEVVGEKPPGSIIFAPDSGLRPIRDPGDDAQDEMLRPLPKAEPATAPVRQEVPA